MPNDLLERLRRFHDDAFPLQRSHFRMLVDDGQHPTTLFIGCSEDGQVHVFDVQRGAFIAASAAEHAGTGPCPHFDEPGSAAQECA